MLIDYYLILNCSIESSFDLIKANFRKLAKQKHPDVNKSANSDEEFRLLFEAYEILINPSSRKEYDIQWENFYGSRKINNDITYEDLFFTEKNKSNQKSKHYSKMNYNDFGNSSFSDIDFIIENSKNISLIIILGIFAFILFSIPILLNDTGDNYMNLLVVIIFFGLSYVIYRQVKVKSNVLASKYKESKKQK